MRSAASAQHLVTMVAALALGLLAVGVSHAQEGIAVTVELERLPGALVVAPSPDSGIPGETVFYIFWVVNTGDLATSYRLRLESADGFSASLPEHGNGRIAPLAPGEAEAVPVAVAISDRQTVGSSGATTLYATADEKPRPIGSASVTTTVAPGTEPEKTVLAPPGQSGAAGDILMYEFQVVNIGTNDASYRLRTESSIRKWVSYLPQHPRGLVGPLAPGETETVPVAVEIPSRVAAGTVCVTTLRAVRLGRPRITDEGSVTTTVVALSGLTLSLLSVREPPPGEAWMCRAVVNSSLPEPRDVLVTATAAPGWEVSVGEARTVTLGLGPGSSAEVQIQVLSPPEVANQKAYLLVTATGLGTASMRAQAVAKIGTRTAVGP